jgi:hypothetical protein
LFFFVSCNYYNKRTVPIRRQLAEESAQQAAAMALWEAVTSGLGWPSSIDVSLVVCGVVGILSYLVYAVRIYFILF